MISEYFTWGAKKSDTYCTVKPIYMAVRFILKLGFQSFNEFPYFELCYIQNSSKSDSCSTTISLALTLLCGMGMEAIKSLCIVHVRAMQNCSLCAPQSAGPTPSHCPRIAWYLRGEDGGRKPDGQQTTSCNSVKSAVVNVACLWCCILPSGAPAEAAVPCCPLHKAVLKWHYLAHIFPIFPLHTNKEAMWNSH